MARRWPAAVYVPNLIGYARIILTALAFSDWRSPHRFFWLYYFGFVLDAFDGLAARMLNQSSVFGAQLDMITDRCATGALLTLLATLYPSEYAPLFVGLIFLDGYSHWLQMLAGFVKGDGNGSHKTAGRGRLLNLYYWRPVLTVVCSLNEMAFLMLYLKAFDVQGPQLSYSIPISSVDIVLYSSAPVAILKQFISITQVISAHDTISDALEVLNSPEKSATDNNNKVQHRAEAIKNE